MRWLLVAAILLAGCGRDPSRGRVDPELAAYIPPDTVLLAGLRIASLRASPLWDARLDRRTGTMKEVLAAVTPDAWIVLVRGELPDMPPAWRVRALRRDVGAVGEMDAVRHGSSPAAGRLLEAVAGIPEGAAVWAVMDAGESRTLGVPGGQSGNTRRLLAAVRSFRGWALVASEVTVEVAAVTRDPRQSEDLAATLRGLATLARATVHPRFQPLLDHMEIAASEAGVSLRVAAPAASVRDWLR